MFIVDISRSIYLESNSPSYTSIPAIAYYIRTQIGTLNNLLCEDFTVNEQTLEINDCGHGKPINKEAVGVLKQLYRVYDLQQQINNMMNALASDSLLSVQDNFGGTNFTRINKNEIAKTLISLRKDEIAQLDKYVNAYKIRKSIGVQVAGSDTISEMDNPIFLSLRDV